MLRRVIAVLAAAVWISASEFFRNEFLLKTLWLEHYQGLGLVFPSAPINGAVWGLWSLAFAIAIYFLSRRFTLLQTTALAWLFGFVLMWLVTGNMLVLPFGILPFAIPLSLLECFIASYLLQKLDPQPDG